MNIKLKWSELQGLFELELPQIVVLFDDLIGFRL